MGGTKGRDHGGMPAGAAGDNHHEIVGRIHYGHEIFAFQRSKAFWKNLSIEKDVKDDTGFLLSNKKGSYASFCFPNISRYNGFFVFEDNDMFKIIDEIRVNASGKISQLKNYFCFTDVCFESCRQRFFTPKKTNALAIELDSEKEIELFFDIKKSFDNDENGRMYDVKVKGNNAFITYTKMKAGAEDYKIYAVVRCDGSIEKKDSWVKKDFPYDRKRNSDPSGWYTYNCLKLKAGKIVITAYMSQKKAEKESSDVMSGYTTLIEDEIKEIDDFSFPSKAPLNVAFAYLSCYNSMKSLVYEKSMFAGLPWFFQFWSRDSAISLKALIDMGVYGAAKEIIIEILSRMDSEGNIKAASTKNNDSLNSADALGFILLRLGQLIRVLNDSGKLRKYISKKEEKELIAMAENALFLAEKFRTKDGFAVNGPNETWMDTDFNNDTRTGMRIEIQALRLASYKVIFDLTKKKKFKESEKKLKELVYKRFWNKNYLDDGLGDPTIRPNIFLAAYIYPDILSEEEWTRCFSSVIPALWLDWGGFSTIDRKSSLFCGEYTGENNRSYHRGDSWFWINNYAALVMSRLGSGKFKDITEKIIEASCEEILWKGMLGCHAEVSSAKELRSEGCWSQLWSSASFIELIDGLYLGK